VQGANQAVAAARLSSSNISSSNSRVRFVGRFGNDSYAPMLVSELAAAGVNLAGCSVVPDLGSGQGIVMLEPDGAASSIVVGGANTAWGKVSSTRLLISNGAAAAQWTLAPCATLYQTKLYVHGTSASTHSLSNIVSTLMGNLVCCCVQGAVLDASALSGVGVLLLQREVPYAVNLAAAQAAADAGVPVMLVSCSVQWQGGMPCRYC
jgi:hypothetical protein